MSLSFESIRQGPLSLRLIFYIVILSLLITLLSAVLQTALEYRQGLQAIQANLQLVENSYLQPIAASNYHVNEELLQVQLQGLIQLEDIVYAEVTEPGRAVTYRLSAGNPDARRDIEQTFPLLYQTATERTFETGTLTVAVNLDGLYSRIKERIVEILAENVLRIFLIVLFMLFLTQSIVTRHLVKIASYADSIRLDQLEDELTLERKARKRFRPDEFDRLVAAINNMRLRLLDDIIEREQAEEEKAGLESRLQQAQKMEAIGTLAGGIAHDFNNILTVITGYAEMARDDCQPDTAIAKELDHVLDAGIRAKELVQQILAFSRQADTECISFQPASIAKEAIKMLRTILPTSIEITMEIDHTVGLIFADPTQIHQILMNLCTNAFHAMEETGGSLDISLKERKLSIEDLMHEPHVEAGNFVQLSVCDSGPGVAQEIKDKIFDPYFTTKEPGKGTGMGLSIVHGIVKSCGGFISLDSEPGKGTSFHVFLPVIGKEELPANEAVDQIQTGRERILFIDDEEIITKMSKDMLERLGYQVTVRNSSLEALETFQNQPDQFDLVITDQTMPGMTGSDLAEKMMQIRPDIPIILCTGYSSIISEEEAKAMGIKEFILKPLSKRDIANLIRKVLDAK